MTDQVAGFAPDPQLFPFQSRWLDSSAGRVHYLDEGDGVPIRSCCCTATRPGASCTGT